MNTTAANYVGRTVDLSLFANVPTQLNDRRILVQSLAPSGLGYVATGVQKVMQRFLMRLFTIKGSMLYAPTEGCYFMRDALQGRFNSTADVISAFSSSALDILAQFESERRSDDPLDEIVVAATLQNVLLYEDGVSIAVQLRTADGVNRQIITPLPISV